MGGEDKQLVFIIVLVLAVDVFIGTNHLPKTPEHYQIIAKRRNDFKNIPIIILRPQFK